eukprot:CAMPEP_0197676720 /NCGR_PEP_ID=MMETSP1338-20131121/87274_1 /TAXON_ID=43686 ORGANISM="Pelagodinium beii, Strain RCC1491" /NCGR_SAMPLE_ID=MMETSP1338 /ASSEMBLY_ACC=CAM_ASM_000754 /LENGTH=43 /DNA_ID= /DNA_START= /DNA_END= /DNA_ORIENTATION=
MKELSVWPQGIGRACEAIREQLIDESSGLDALLARLNAKGMSM